jgi:hypothetical protein
LGILFKKKKNSKRIINRQSITREESTAQSQSSGGVVTTVGGHVTRTQTSCLQMHSHADRVCRSVSDPHPHLVIHSTQYLHLVFGSKETKIAYSMPTRGDTYSKRDVLHQVLVRDCCFPLSSIKSTRRPQPVLSL